MGLARINAEERPKKESRVKRAKKKKGIEAQRAKSNPTQAIEVLIWDKEQVETHKKKKETGSGHPIQEML